MDEKLAEDARKYYEFALVNLLTDSEAKYISTGNAIELFYVSYPPRKRDDRTTHNVFLHLTIRKLTNDGSLDEVSDSFSPPFIKLSQELNQKGIHNAVSKKYEKLEEAGDAWLRSAFNSIADHFDQNELLDYYKRQIGEMETRPSRSAQAANDPNEAVESQNDSEDKWEPIKIDRSQPEYMQAIEASEAALREIESSNGYASSATEERNAIVATIRGTLTAIKEGTPSKAALIAGLIRPFEYVAKKFSEVTMGEIAKIAVSKLWALIASWMQ